MARSARSPGRKHSLVLQHKVKVTVREAPFRTFATLKRLDVKRLERAARARFEVGWFETGCGQRIVHAVVEKGRVTRLELEPCTNTVRMTPELRSLAQAARKALKPPGRPAHRLPVAVGRFLSNAHGFTIEVYGCFTICIFDICLTCCFGLPDPDLNGCTLSLATA